MTRRGAGAVTGAGRCAARIVPAVMLLAWAAGADPDPRTDPDTLEAVAPAADTLAADTRAGGHTGARLFGAWEAVAEGGVVVPWGDLADVLDPAPLAGLRVTTTYYGDWRAMATLSGARLDGPDSPVPVAWIAGAAGLEWRLGSGTAWGLRPWIPAAGLGLALYYIRAAGEEDPPDGYLFLDDGESEFGLQGSLRWVLPLSRTLGLEAGARWDMMFTSPAYTHAPSLTLGAAWTP